MKNAMTDEDWEFNRIEMESRIRQEYVRVALAQQREKDMPTGIPFITPEELEELLKNS